MNTGTPAVAPDDAPAAPPRRHARRWILAALMCTMMLAAMDTAIVSTAIPQIVGDLGGFALFSWVFSIYLLAQTVTIPIYGKLSDLFGRKRVLLVGTVIFLAGSAASAAAWNMPALIIFRGIQGLGAGSIMATVSTLAGDLYSVRERAAIQGWLSSVWGMGAIFNAGLRTRLESATGHLATVLPDDVNQVIGALQHHGLPRAALDYLRAAIDTATAHLYVAALVADVGLLFAVIIIPRRFAATS